MIILANRRDDILKRKSEYEAMYNERKAKYSRQREQYYKDLHAVRSELINLLPKNSIKLDIDATIEYRGDEPTFKVVVSDESDMFNSEKPLSWKWAVTLDSEGKILKESSSWSGLNATTDVHIDKLKDIVDILQTLNTIDWETVLNTYIPPDIAEYMTETDPDSDPDKPDFDYELLVDDIDSIIGTNYAILSTNSKFYRTNVYRMIIKSTDKRYTIVDIPSSAVASDGTVERGIEYWSNPYSVNKTFVISSVYKPVTIIELK